jgi:hypothetical protein
MTPIKNKLIYRLLLHCLACIFSITAYCQNSPVKWEFSARPISSELYEVKVSAFIQDGWYLYSQKLPADGINLPTNFIFSNAILKGELAEEGKLEKNKDESLQIESWYFKNKVVFKGIVAVRSAKEPIAGSVEFQTCTGEKCLSPIKNNFRIAINSQ